MKRDYHTTVIPPSWARHDRAPFTRQELYELQEREAVARADWARVLEMKWLMTRTTETNLTKDDIYRTYTYLGLSGVKS